MKVPTVLVAMLAAAFARAQERLPDPKPVPATPRPEAPSDPKPLRASPAMVVQPLTPESGLAPAQPAMRAVPAPRQLSSQEAADALGEGELRQVVEHLRGSYLHPDALSETALARAGIQGLLDRLGAGARIFPAAGAANPPVSAFRSEILDGNVAYLCLGTLTRDNLAALDSALDAFGATPPREAILDLRSTPPGADFELAAECCRGFVPKGRVLFSIKRPKANDEEILTSREDPRWRGVLIVLVDGDTAGAGEVIAAVLRTHLRAYIIGQKTKGEAAQFEDVPLAGGRVLRIATGEVALPDATPVFPGGLTPDLTVNVPQEETDHVLQLALNAGSAAPFVIEKARARFNEAALVAGTNPELDDVLESQRQKAKGASPAKPRCDVVLQRALDFIASVRIYGGKAEGTALKK